MRTILLSAFFFALALHVGLQAQQPIDSLRKAMFNGRKDTHLVWTYRQLLRELYALEGKENEALGVAQKGLSLCRKLNFETGTDLFSFTTPRCSTYSAGVRKPSLILKKALR
ncbi:MAG: hypothetical protein IPH16_02185 [Haliscomenobacter sp.]|nr:hypothetical protein [Haliscomenobacter sp.]